MIGQRISHYEVVARLGEGGMGVVYKARDLRLDRFVALKFLPPGLGPDSAEQERFTQEARAASALDHPNICTIHGIETDAGRMFIVMACYEGETLFERIRRGPMPIDDVLRIGRQIALGLGRAHEKGIVHRDLKPANVFVTTDGTVKILDFGIARLLDQTHMTRAGATVGTVGYMAPEQARGETVDARADVWALGVILHEMLTGKSAFGGGHPAVVLDAIRSREPARLSDVRPDTPAALVTAIERALAKDPAQRLASAAHFVSAIDSSDLEGRKGVPAGARRWWRRPVVVMPIAGGIMGLLLAAAWFGYQWNRASWARNVALPEITRLAAQKNYEEAFALADRAAPFIPDDPVLARAWTEISVLVGIESDPAGAAVEIRPYAQSSAGWRSVGTTPLPNVRLPRGPYRWRFSKPGYQTVDRAAEPTTGIVRVSLPAEGTAPPGTILIPKSREVTMVAAFGLPQDVELDDFYVQTFEVTNRDYKRFVDAGGYRRRDYWKHPFVREGRELRWDEAVALFTDKANQPGPSTWEVGTFPPGQDDAPVAGVSWFEAAAYAEYAGMSLPTIHHWFRAAGVDAGPYILPLANFDYKGPRPVGASGAMSPSGAHDMAGNVKEWSATATTDGMRYSLGGGWSEPQYLFGDPEPRSPFDRNANQGLRLVKYATELPASIVAPRDRQHRDFRAESSVPDAMFAQFSRMHAYPARPLEPRIEKTLASQDGQVIVERVSFAAAYPGERVVAYLWLPKDAKPPYQTVVLFPGAETFRPATGDVLEQPDRYDFLVRSGRAVIHPVYRGMYERFAPFPRQDPIGMRDHLLFFSKDFRRTLEYVATRGDLDAAKVAYFGASFGAAFGPLMVAGESRVRLALLVGGGLPSSRLEPEIDVIHYLPRMRLPTLLLNGRYDFFFPYEASQKPFFERIGTPAEDKRHVTVEAAHSVPRAEYLRELLGWLDKYFGPAR
jgi:dienelactone hydrolase